MRSQLAMATLLALAALVRRRRPGRPQKNGMKMHDIDFADRVMKRLSQRRRPIKSSDEGTSEVLDVNAVKIHRRRDWSASNFWPVDVSGKDLQFVPSCRQ